MSIASQITRLQNAKADIKTAIEAKGVTVSSSATLDAYDDYIASIPTGGGEEVIENDVNFYDYDGTLVDSYSKSDFLELTAMPDNPTHEGLTSQGWNWSLSDAQTYVQTNGYLEIGQMYVTSDGATRLYIELEEGRLKPYLGFAVNGSATVNWGDNTTSTITGTSTDTVISTQHTYSQGGKYVISISSESKIYFIGNNKSGVGSRVIWYNQTTGYLNTSYQYGVKKVELGSNIEQIDNYAFRNCMGLETITMPNTISSIGNYAFNSCRCLKHITIPSGMTSIGSYCFQTDYNLGTISMPKSLTSIGEYFLFSCSALRKITFSSGITSMSDSLVYENYLATNIVIPEGVTSIGASNFTSCYRLINIKLPSTITSIGNYAFSSCYSIVSCDFSNHTSIPTAGSSMFGSVSASYKIIVPDNLYNDWVSAWSSYSSHIISKTDWDNL